MTTKFDFNNKEYKIEIKWRAATETLPDKFGIELLKLFVNPESAQDTMQRMMFDDLHVQKLMWFYLEDQVSFTFEEYIDLMSQEALEKFREAFWVEVGCFFVPLKRRLIAEMWEMFKKEMRDLDLKKLSLDNSPSNSQPEQV